MRRLLDRLAEYVRRKSFRFGVIAVLAAVVAVTAAHPALAQSNQSAGWTEVAFAYLSALGLAVAEVIGKLVIAALDVVIPVMQYQGFTTSPVVVAGWAIVRDVVNMFFVVVLIVIAMGTIFGHSRFQWKQQVPKLMIFALVINFSKTLCGLMIDFAQVVMITFANALKDIAGGNFIQLLGLGDIFSLSEKAATIANSATGTGPGASSFDWFAASAAAVLMMVWVLAVVVMLLFVLVYRVVMLWILIVIAPLAWFMGGQSVFKSDAYAEWWRNFICYTAIGPVITFFLWLTLAVAGSGFIAANDPGLSSIAPAGDLNSNASDFVTKIFEWQRLTSFVVGMAMLMVGFDAASKICHGVKGPGFQALLSAGKGAPSKIGGYVGGGVRKYGGKGLTYGKTAALGTGALAAGLATTVGSADVNWKDRAQALAPTRAGQAARADLLRKGSKRLPGALSGTARSMSLGADTRQAELAETAKKASAEAYKDASDETKLDTLIRLANGNPQAFEKAENAGLLMEALKSSKMRDKLDAAGVLGTLTRDHLPQLKKEVKGTKEYEAIDEFEAARPDLTGKISSINTFEDVQKLDASALAAISSDPALRRSFLANLSSKSIQSNVSDGAGGTLSAEDWLERGHGGGKRTKAWTEGMTGYYENMSDVNLRLVPADNIAANASPMLMTRRPDAAPATAAHRSVAARERMNSNRGMRRQVAGQAFGVTYTAAGTIGSVDAKRVQRAVKDNVGAVKNMSRTDMTGGFATAVADAYSRNASLDVLATQYLVSTADERNEMDASVLANVIESFDEAEAQALAAGNPTAAGNYASRRASLLGQLEAVRGGKAAMITELDSQLTALRSQELRLRGLRSPTPAQTRELSRVTADIATITARRAMH